MKKLLIVTALTLSLMPLSAQEITQECKDRARDLVSKMTLEEKIDYISGYNDGFPIRPVERLGIPEIRLADGPQSVRKLS